ncbi:bacterial regulatory helix-turn-helix, lysR family protein, partial [Vibrio parahaemolyticus V-223/04]
TELQR